MSKVIKNKKTTKLSKLESDVQNLEHKFKRVLADYQNQTKRHQTHQAKVVKFANQSLLDKLLPILDSLELAQLHLKDDGIQMIIDQFIRVIELEGVTIINSTNQKFDPNIMDCASLVKGPKDVVTSTLIKGYTYNGETLRPAKVEVGSGHVSSSKSRLSQEKKSVKN
jgi:molecular chaperone GrpE